MRPPSKRLIAVAFAVCSASMLVVAGVATAAAQTIPPAVKTVQATGSPVLAGSGRAWDGPGVAVLDSGVDVHVDLNVAGGADCTGIGTFADGNGHGTGVSGIIAAKDNGTGILGIAPGAPIYSVRVLDAKLKGSPSTIVCGMDWVLKNAEKYNIKVVNLSFAAPSTDDGNCGRTNADVMHQKVCELTAAGLVVVASAGNEAKDLSYLVPASYDEVLTATNVADYDGVPGGLGKSPCTALDADDSIYNASNFAVSDADKAHVVAAPGVCPYTTKKGNQVGYIQSGTSMSAAALSGVVLDCLRPGGACVGQSVDQVRATIKSAAAQAAAKGHTFRGDPLSPISGRYYGYLATTAQSGGTTPPTSTPTTTTTTTTTTNPTTSTTTTNPTTTTPTTTTTTTPTPPSGCSTAAAKAAVVIPAAVPPLTGAAATAAPRTTAQATVEPPLLTLDTTAPLTPEAFPALAAADTTKPQTAITAPKDATTVAGTLCLQAAATDDVGVTGVSYWINGTTKVGDGVRQPSGSWDLAVNTKQLRNGTYALTSRATDAAGNVGTSTAVKVVVKN